MSWMNDLVMDGRQTVRSWKRAPGQPILAAVALTLGVAACTAIFSIVDAVVLNPLPIRNANDLVYLMNPPLELRNVERAPSELLRPLKGMKTLEAISAFHVTGLNVATKNQVRRIAAAGVSTDFFRVLGMKFIAGRGFSDEDMKPGNNQIAIISERLWSQDFNLDSSILGRTLITNSRQRTIIGVVPENSGFPFGVDIWVPVFSAPDLFDGDVGILEVIARLRPEVRLGSVEAELRSLMVSPGSSQIRLPSLCR